MTHLPKPNGQFEWTQESWGPALRCVPLQQVAPHRFTTRHLRLKGSFADTGSAWAQLAAAVGAAPGRLLRMRQVHGARVIQASGVTLGDAHDEWPEADIAIADDPAVALVVRVADCVPLLLGDPRTGAVAAVHAGWRGTAAGAATAAVGALVRTYGVRAADLTAAVGPSIGPCCYIVGPELIEQFAGHADAPAWFLRDPVLRLDLWRATHDQLRQAGLDEQRIHLSTLCTACHTDLFCSYRKEGERTGRLAGAIRAASPRSADPSPHSQAGPRAR